MEENKRIFSDKNGLSKNLVTPIAVIILITGLAVWLVPDDDAEKETKKPLPKLGSVVRPLDQATDDVDNKISNDGVISRSKIPDSKDARSLIAKLRQAGGNTGQKAFEEAEKQRSMGNNADAYLLYFFAAKQGNGDAALVLGTQSDPTYFTSINSTLDAPDPGQAIKWYRLAIDAGNKAAKQNLAELSKRIKKQAEAGSDQAQRLMLQLR